LKKEIEKLEADLSITSKINVDAIKNLKE